MALFSGGAALVYQVAWTKMLALTFGSTTLSAGAVVAGFMGGMGLGAWAYRFVERRASRPLAVYASLEFGIAGSSLLLTWAFLALPSAFASMSASLPSGIGLAMVRIVVVFLLLLAPAMLMGATFPALCAVMIRSTDGVDRYLGMIYGLNTVGAAAGAVFGGLVLLASLGLRGGVLVAQLVNVAIGITALVLLRRSEGGVGATGDAPTETAIPTALPRLVTGIVLVGSGFTTLAYEIVWFRATRYLMGNSTYALTTVLSIFLVGLGLGSMLLRRGSARQAGERDLALCQAAI